MNGRNKRIADRREELDKHLADKKVEVPEPVEALNELLDIVFDVPLEEEKPNRKRKGKRGIG